MRFQLLRQGTPVPIRRFLTGHTVRTTRQEGWATLTNGNLFRVAEEAGFDVLLTTDNSIAYRQNLNGPEDRHCGSQPEPVADGAADDSKDRRGG